MCVDDEKSVSVCDTTTKTDSNPIQLVLEKMAFQKTSLPSSFHLSPNNPSSKSATSPQHLSPTSVSAHILPKPPQTHQYSQAKLSNPTPFPQSTFKQVDAPSSLTLHGTEHSKSA